MESRLIEAPASGVVRDYKMLIGSEWVDALSGTTLESVNPYTGRVWATAPEAGEEDVNRAVKAVRAAFDEGPWRTMTGTERGRLIRRLAELINENAESIALIESTDNGKLLKEMRGQLNAMPE
jgi:acyl-CoA reductase-like NAD-dependent aldehyde dehydrogenase